ncbi:hypothetical protein GLAREA_06400 [Glarea lozoyensis ATCC 20868]|uniref:Heterokaryon incompatibility domain-containing protein n=1 Tax=Glarea lozoyensis (strain ATCC 20868 / MF5171) TaxID=1116229 RepID=S3D4L7_GLAL2|nr:uncharacterized protein GLAREA_06400 [Glarea lozoyensis ATCC 20868]EPE33387.1 hypothetical protein GLAREA_06400 [Glarea lozoyensis ATCC 20868]
MALVYENAHLVIAATTARDSSGGCFSTRRSPCLFYQHTTSADITISFYLREESKSHKYFAKQWFCTVPSLYDKLLTRSWALQERLLATRIVHFVGDDLVWQCRKQTSCECNALRSHPGVLKIGWNKELEDRDSYLESQRFLWNRIIRHYMTLKITKVSDELPALSGLAKKFQAAGAGDYLAGLWRETILADLLWTVCEGKRAEKWQAPSWSWASLEKEGGGLICPYGFDSSDRLDCRHLRPGDPSATSHKSGVFGSTLLKTQCEPAGEDSTGNVKQPASLTISTPLIEVMGQFTEPELSSCIGLNITISRNGQVLIFDVDCEEDFEEYEGESFPLVCAWIGTEWHDSKYLPQIMVLRNSLGICGASSTPNAFERVGVIDDWNGWDQEEAERTAIIADWFSDSQVTTITIV